MDSTEEEIVVVDEIITYQLLSEGFKTYLKLNANNQISVASSLCHCL